MDRAILWGQFFCDESKMEIPVDTAVLVGPSQSGKTSFLIQYASNIAESNQAILLCCNHLSHSRPPCIVHPWSLEEQDCANFLDERENKLHRVGIKYLVDDLELRIFLANLHLIGEFEVVAIDSIMDFFWRYENTQEAIIQVNKTLAIAVNAVRYSKSVPSTLLVGLAEEQASHALIDIMSHSIHLWIQLSRITCQSTENPTESIQVTHKAQIEHCCGIPCTDYRPIFYHLVTPKSEGFRSQQREWIGISM